MRAPSPPNNLEDLGSRMLLRLRTRRTQLREGLNSEVGERDGGRGTPAACHPSSCF
jgi:hypothetical protein